MGGSSWIALVLAVVACGSTRPPPPPPPPAPAPPPPVVVAPPPALVSPGPLSAGHAAFGCNQCHVDDSKDISNERCLACHELLRIRIVLGKGFHASVQVRGKSCGACHLDHRGAAYDTTGWASVGGRGKFDHDSTGWKLEGAHARRSCEDCHHGTDLHGLPTFVGTDKLCGGCHAATVHAFTAKPMLACERCHTQASWKPVLAQMKFNHDDRKDAAMPLLGMHANVPCVKCHPAERFKLAFAKPDDCGNCHASQHAGTIMATQPCEQCHSPTFKSFQANNFDHTERTRLDLGPAHRQLPCARCHTKALGATRPPLACEGCHAARSPHGNRFDAVANQCGLCHSSSSAGPAVAGQPPPKWRVNAERFDHRKLAHFPLYGKHATIGCRACHRGHGPTDFERLTDGFACMDCHAHNKVHADPGHPDGRYTNAECTKCHPSR